MSEELHIKKVDLNANNIYEYEMLKNLKHDFIQYEYEETIDEIIIRYNIDGLKSIKDFISDKRKVKYSLLIELMEIIRENSQIYFSLSPENIFVNDRQRIKILVRDINGEHQSNKIDEIRALAGFLFQKKYSYNDYINGGLSLLSKNEDTKFLANCSEENELYKELNSLFNKELDKEKLNNITVGKNSYLAIKSMAVIFAAISICMSIMFFRQSIIVLKPSLSALYAERSYLEMNYINVIDNLKDVSVSTMNEHEKYILAVAYIRSQSVDAFSEETKDMLIDRLSYNSDVKQLDYWIYLGRTDADNAIDIAQRLSDNQLLLYAYIQKYEIVSADTTLYGDDKSSQLNSIRENIKDLAQTLGIKYEPEKTEE